MDAMDPSRCPMTRTSEYWKGRRRKCNNCGGTREEHRKPRDVPPSRPIVESRTVVICHEKHGSLYFVVDNDEELRKVALSIVTKRLALGYWYEKPGDEPKAPDYTREDVEKLPASMRTEAHARLLAHQKQASRWRQESEAWDEINRCVLEKDGRAAWRVLRDMSDGEYARVSLEKALTEYPQYGNT